MNHLNRRDFVKRTAAAAAAWTAAPYLARAADPRVIGPNEEIRFAVVGFNGQGGSHLSSLKSLRDQGQKVRVVALCDVDANVLAKGVKAFQDRGEDVAGFSDIRKLLEDKNVDALSIATPNHWHALATIWAVEAGKDVYVEKPVSHNVWEGRQMVKAARRLGRIVQTGTQCRSSSGIREAVAWVQAGNLGKIQISRGLCYKRRASIGKTEGPQPIPPGIDYDLWCGPAPQEPLRRKRLHYDWHWVWPTGCGDLGNQGIHQMDIARWFLGEPALSPAVISVGGRLGYVDDGTTPNTQIIFHDYPKAPLIFEVRGLTEKAGSDKMDKFMGAGIGVVVHCEGGYVVVPDYTSATAYDKSGAVIKKFSGATSHHGNFVAAVRSRKHTDLNADILEGHLSSALCHTGNISYRLGHEAAPDDILAGIKAQKDGEASFQRMLEHLKANEVDLLATKASLGVLLKMDPATERFVGNDAANALLTRDYRAPFVVKAQA